MLLPPKLNEGVGLDSAAVPPKLKAGAAVLDAPKVVALPPPNVGAGLLAPNVEGVVAEKLKPLLVGAAPKAGVVVAVPPKLNPPVEAAGKVAAGAGAVPPKLKLGAAEGVGVAPNDGAGVVPNEGAGVEPKAGVAVDPKDGVVPKVPPVDDPNVDIVEVAGWVPNEKAGVVEAVDGNEKPPVSDAPKCLGLRDEASIPSLLSTCAVVPPKLKAGGAEVAVPPKASPVLVAGLLTPPKLNPPLVGSVFGAPPKLKPTLGVSAGLAALPKLNAGGAKSAALGVPPKLKDTGLGSSALGVPPKLKAGAAEGLASVEVPPKLNAGAAAGLDSVVDPPKLKAGAAAGASGLGAPPKLNAGAAFVSAFFSAPPKLKAGAGLASSVLVAAPKVKPPVAAHNVGGLSSSDFAAPNVKPVEALVAVLLLPKSKLVLVPKPVLEASELATGAAPNLKAPVLVTGAAGFSGSLAPGLSVSQALHFTTSSGLESRQVPQFHPEGFRAPAAKSGPGAMTAGLAGAIATDGLDAALAVPQALHASTPTSLFNIQAEQLHPLGANFAMRFIAPGTAAAGTVAAAAGLGPGLAVPHAIHLPSVVALLSIQPSHDHPLGANLAKDPDVNRPPRAGLTSAASNGSVFTATISLVELELFLGLGDWQATQRESELLLDSRHVPHDQLSWLLRLKVTKGLEGSLAGLQVSSVKSNVRGEDLDTLAICTGGFIGVIGALLIPKGERSEEVAGLGASQPLHLDIVLGLLSLQGTQDQEPGGPCCGELVLDTGKQGLALSTSSMLIEGLSKLNSATLSLDTKVLARGRGAVKL